MIGLIVAGLLKTGVAQETAEKLAKPVQFITLALLAIPAILAMKSCYDSSVAEDYVNEANADFAEDVIEAEREAGAAKNDRDAASQAENDELMETIDDAEESDNSAADNAWDRLWD